MNFEQEFKTNIYEPWRSEYVNYEEIQFNLSQQRWTQQEFESALRSEANKVELFITKKQREIESRIVSCERALSRQPDYEAIDDTLTETLLDLNDLSKYTRNNFLALQRLIQEAGSDNQLMQWLRSKSLDKQRFDVILVKISTLHDICGLKGKKRRSTSISAQEIEKAKYWVHPDNITELKALLLFHLPVTKEDNELSNVYLDNAQFDLYQGRLQRDEGAEAIRCRWQTNQVSIERKTHHAAWKNGASVKDTLTLNMDQVGSFLSGEYSATRYAEDLKQRHTTEVVQSSHAFAQGVQRSIRERQLAPVVRLIYHRTTFQIPGDARLRITLDTDLSYVKEESWPPSNSGDDYVFPYAVLETSVQTPPEWLTRLVDSRLVYEVPRFSKYLQGVATLWNTRLPLLPWWLDQLELDIRNAKQPQGNFSGLSRSKSLKPLIDGQYRTGYLESQLERTAALERNQRGSNPFDDPVWNETLTPTASSYLEKRMDGRQTSVFVDSASTDFLIGKSTQSSYLHTDKNEKIFREEVVVVDKPTVQEDEEEEKPKKKKKKKEAGATVEPKIFFANERTFIHWLHFSAIILSVALTLLNFGDSINRVVGGIFFGISFIFAIYAFGFYRWRAHRITNLPHLRFDDVFGPVFLCILLVGALVLNFALRFNSPPQNNAYLGVNSTNSDTTS
ncbi:unnamed protein product [Rhizopus stolonifer]